MIRLHPLRLAILIAAATLPALAASKHHHDTAPTADEPVAPANNPMLPPAINLTALWPELTLIQKAPLPAPEGLDPLYSQADWDAYRAEFGAAADALPKQRASGIAAFAEKLIAAATARDQPIIEGPATTGPATRAAIHDLRSTTRTPGLRRLLLLRAATITYRNREGNAVAHKALAAFVPVCSRGEVTHMAALFTIADAMARQIATPKETRTKDAALAAKANLQLCLLLIDQDQIAAASAIIKLLGRHEGAVKADPQLKVNAALTRALVRQTDTMLADLGEKYVALGNGDSAAAIPLYLYARYVKSAPDVAANFAARRRSTPVGQLDTYIQRAATDPQATYNVADSLRTLAGTLPEGILKHRTLYAALTLFRRYLTNPATEGERVKRTLARMAIQQVIADGAAGPPVIEVWGEGREKQGASSKKQEGG